MSSTPGRCCCLGVNESPFQCIAGNIRTLTLLTCPIAELLLSLICYPSHNLLASIPYLLFRVFVYVRLLLACSMSCSLVSSLGPNDVIVLSSHYCRQLWYRCGVFLTAVLIGSEWAGMRQQQLGGGWVGGLVGGCVDSGWSSVGVKGWVGSDWGWMGRGRAVGTTGQHKQPARRPTSKCTATHTVQVQQ